MYKRFYSFINGRYVNSNCVVRDIKLIIKLIIIVKLLLLSYPCGSSLDYLKLLLSF